MLLKITLDGRVHGTIGLTDLVGYFCSPKLCIYYNWECQIFWSATGIRYVNR